MTAAPSRWQLDATVVGYEKVKVPAGEFDAFWLQQLVEVQLQP